MDFSIFADPQVIGVFIDGLWVTLQLLIWSVVFGAVLSIPLALLRNSVHWWLRGPVWLYTYLIRGTPMLIQVYLIYYGISQLEWIQARWETVWPWVYFRDATFCVLLAFILNTCGYTVELLAGALRDTPRGELEAAAAFGYSRTQVQWRIALPSALRRVLPGYSNEVIMMLHGTAVASVVPSVIDLTGAARQIYSDFYLPFEAFIAAGLIYLCVTFILVGAFKLIEWRWLVHLRPRA